MYVIALKYIVNNERFVTTVQHILLIDNDIQSRYLKVVWDK